MGNSELYRILPDGRVLLDYGPMTISISAKKNGISLTEKAIMGAEKALESFNGLLPFLPAARRFICDVPENAGEGAPEVFRKMVSSVRLLNDPTFTPMAAVAGSFADVILEEVLRDGEADYAVVNNGGDIAYRTVDSGSPFRVGIISDITHRLITHSLEIPADSGIHGIATSGFGGRSLSRGFASAVTVLAETCNLADAAATDIANHTYCPDPAVVLCPAEEIDFDSDITGLTVVKEVGPLSHETVRTALENGCKRARLLYEEGMIRGAVLFVRNCYTCYPDSLTITKI